MKNDPKSAPAPVAAAASPEPHDDRVGSLLRFWGSFFICLVVLGIISGLMLAGLFLLMGYRVF